MERSPRKRSLWTAAAVGALILGTTTGALAQQADTSVSGSAVGLDAKMSAVLDSLKASGVPTQANNNNPPAGQVNSQFGETHPVQIGNQTVRVGGPLAESIEAANARAALAVGQAGLNAEFAQGQAGLQAQQAIGQAGLNAQAAQAAAQQHAAFAAGQTGLTTTGPTTQAATGQAIANGQVSPVHELRIGNQTFRLAGPLEEAMQQANQRAAFETGQAGLNAEFAMGQAGLRALQQTGELGLTARAAQQRAAAANQASPTPDPAPSETSTSTQIGGVQSVRIGNDTFRVAGPLAESIEQQQARAALAVGQAGLNAEFATGQAGLRALQQTGELGLTAEAAQQRAAAPSQPSPTPDPAAGQTSTGSQIGGVQPVRIGNDTFRVAGPLAEKIEEQEAKAAFAVGQAGLNAEFQNGQTALRAEQQIGQAGISAQMAQASQAQKAAFAVGQAGLAAAAAPAASAGRSSSKADHVSHGAPRNTGGNTVR